jgi:nitrogen fixation protein NifX
MQVAIATQDRKNVDGHFGSASCFMIYDVSEIGYKLIHEVAFDAGITAETCTGPKEDNGDRLSVRIKRIEGSRIIFVAAIGGTASNCVMRNNIYPVKISPPESIDQVLTRMQTMLKDNPPIWLRRILNEERS